MGGAITTVVESYNEAHKMEEEVLAANLPLELLDRIASIEDINSERGKERHEDCVKQLRTLLGDSEQMSGFQTKLQLPWEEVSHENQKAMKDFCDSLSKNDSLLSREVDELEYDFQFDKIFYAYQSVMLTKLSNDLRETHSAIVPDLVSDDSFWRNYFYEVELKFSELGEHSKIGGKVSAEVQADRRRAVDAMYETPYIN